MPRSTRTMEERQKELEERRVVMQAVLDMKSQGKTFAEIAAAFDGRWSRQRADQIYRQALAEGMSTIAGSTLDNRHARP